MLIREISDMHKDQELDSSWSFIVDPGTEPIESQVLIDFERLYLSIGGLERAVVINDLKQMTRCWIEGLDGRRKNSPKTALNKVRVVARFYCGMHKEGVEKLSLLTPRKVEAVLVNHVLPGSKLKNTRTVSFILSVVRDLYLFNGWLEDGLIKDPLSFSVRSRLLSGLEYGKRWSAPDEPSSLLLLKKAMDVLEVLPNLVLPRLKIYVQAVTEANSLGLDSKRSVSNYAVERLSGVESSDFNNIAGQSDSYCALSLSKPAHLALLVKRLQDACFIVLTYTSGFRVSELRRMTSKSLIWREHINGEKYPYLIARRSKRRYSALDNNSGVQNDNNPWVLSPAGVRAFSVLTDIASVIKERSGVDNIWACYSGNGLWPLRTSVKKVSIPSGGAFNLRLNKFARFAGLTKDTGWNYKLHTHMGRKHFARFVVKRDRSGLGALALQYSHVSPASVDISYAMPDLEFRRLIQNELAEVMSDVVADLSQQNPVNLFNSKGRSTRFFGSSVRGVDVKRLISQGSILIPCQWGYCDYERTLSACAGGELPNPVRRTPEICSNCPNFIASSIHAQWWEEYLSDSEKLLKLSAIPNQVAQILKARADKAREILKVIGGDNE